MNQTSPSIYLLQGNDEFAIQTFLEKRLKPKMGNMANAAMDITTIDCRSHSLESVHAETHSIPFLSDRRMVVLEYPLSLGKNKQQREKFFSLLESIPPSTACILVVNQQLDNQHWLVRWVEDHPQFTWKRSFILPQGKAMTDWILSKASELGGEFSHQAAQLLASYVNEDPRLARMEIEKLLFYVDFSRPVTDVDVRALTPDVRQGDVFDMVDAIGFRDGPTAMQMMHRLLDESDPLPLFGMIIRQFRLLIQVKEQINEYPSRDHFTIAKELGEHPYPVKKIIPQAHQFSLDQLISIYHQLSEVDEAIKTGQLEPELALDVLVASLTK